MKNKNKVKCSMSHVRTECKCIFSKEQVEYMDSHIKNQLELQRIMNETNQKLMEVNHKLYMGYLESLRF